MFFLQKKGKTPRNRPFPYRFPLAKSEILLSWHVRLGAQAAISPLCLARQTFLDSLQAPGAGVNTKQEPRVLLHLTETHPI